MRDKLITIRVNSELYNQVLLRIDSFTSVDVFWEKKFYNYSDGKRCYFRNKFSIADLFEEKMREYLLESSAQK